MKKVVRMLGLCALVALAFTACKKNDNTNKMTFKATISQPTSDSRTHINNDRYLWWDNGDVITVFNNVDGDELKGQNLTFTVTSEYVNKMDATFALNDTERQFMQNLETSDSYTAFYPVNNVDGNNVEIVLEATQNFAANSFATNTYPMYASNNGDTFEFNSNAGVLQLHMMTQDNVDEVVVGSVVVTAADPTEEIVGTLVYPYDYPVNNAALCTVKPGTGSHQVTLDCSSQNLVVDHISYTVFNIVLLDNALHSGFTVEVKDLSGNTFHTEEASASTANTIHAGFVKKMPAIYLPAHN